jgi:hypothetical protein
MDARSFVKAEGIREWHNPSLGKRSAVPRHTEISNHLARKICADLGVPLPEER